MDSDSETKLISLLTQLLSLTIRASKLDSDLDSDDDEDTDLDFTPLMNQVHTLIKSMDLNLQPKPESEFMSLTTQTISLFNSFDLDSQPKLLTGLTFFTCLKFNVAYSSDWEPDTDSDSDSSSLDDKIWIVISLIHQIFSLVVSMNSKWKNPISLCPLVQVRLKKGKFLVDPKVQLSTNEKWDCLPVNWEKLMLSGEEEDTYTHFRCRGCNGENHKENEKALDQIKHILHSKHSLQLVLLKGRKTRKCYCCDEDLQKIFYYCSPCDFAMNIACVEKPSALFIDYPKWHEHTLSLFPRKALLTCDLCGLTHSSCPFYICLQCDFVVHQSCISLPRVIKISRHPHRISFTYSFGQGDWSCGVCRRKIDNDFGGYSCMKNGCFYAAHSKCATQTNVWDGIELEGEPEDIEEEEVEPFVTISDGIIQHFLHQQHHLRLDHDNTCIGYDENKQCQACIMPIYSGNFYSCLQCQFIIHETCANLSRKIHYPIHPHKLTLLGGHDGLLDFQVDECSICSWLCKFGFFYECGKEGCNFQLHVQCATISEPLVHQSHIHPLYLTSKPGEPRRSCSICKGYNRRNPTTNETFNCIDCEFSLCFLCVTLPQKVKYKHDKHMLTLSYGEESSFMRYWCEICERIIHLHDERFYTCEEYCCVTIHITCLMGWDLYMKFGSSWIYYGKKIDVMPNNHMYRPMCPVCERRCLHPTVFRGIGLVFCSTICLEVKLREYKRLGLDAE